MTNPTLKLKMKINASLIFAFLFLLLQPAFVNAQKEATPAPATCSDRVVGYVKGYVIFDCKPSKKATAENVCYIDKETCECAAKKYKGAKGCMDGNGKVTNITIKKPTKPQIVDRKPTQNVSAAKAIDDPVMEEGEETTPPSDGVFIPFSARKLTGETNCRLNSEGGKYLTIKKASTGLQLIIERDGGGKNSRFSFMPINDEDFTKGFYLVTHGDNPMAVMVDGRNMSLRDFKSLDGMMKQMAQWRYFINGTDKDGNAEYLLMPRNNPMKLVLGVNQNTKKLELVKRSGGGSNSVLPAKTEKNWNCECVF